MTTTRRLTALLGAIAFAAVTCSVPTDENAQVINPEDLPEILRSDVTTSTTSTLPEVRPIPVTYYLLQPDEDRVVAVEREVSASASLQETLAGLFEDFRTEDEQAEGLRHSLLEFRLVSAIPDEGLATIDITQVDPESELDADAIFNAVVQLVWTATGDIDIDLVRILIDSEPQILRTTRPEGDTEEGEPVDRSFFATFDPDFVPETTEDES